MDKLGKKKSVSQSETKVVKASVIDHLIGDVGPDGEKLANGHPVTETKTTTVEEDEKD